MMVSTKGRYALRIMLDLAQQEPGQYCSLSNVSCRQGMSVKYMEAIVAGLNRAGLLESQRGKDGGYRLVIVDTYLAYVKSVVTESDGSGYLLMKSGDSVHFSGSMKVTCTAYTAGYGGVGTRTATGTTVHVGTVAVDKKVIPLGTEMFIVGSSGYTYGNAVAEDTGVRGAAIDLYMNSYQECKQFGRQKNSTVYFLD